MLLTRNRARASNGQPLPVDENLIHWRRVDIGLAPGQSGVPSNIHPWWADMSVFEADERTFAVFKESDGMVVEAQNEELTEWEAVGQIQGVDGECPNLLPLDGRYLLIRSTYPISYLAGDFSTEPLAFDTGVNPVRTLDYGYGPSWPNKFARGLYGTTTFVDAQGRTVLIGWVSGFKTGRGWNGCASLPRVLSFTDDDRLVQTPLPELADLRESESSWQGLLNDESKVLPNIGSTMLEVDARIQPGTANNIGLKLVPEGQAGSEITITYSGDELDVAGTSVPDALSDDGMLNIRVFYDRSVLEVFIDNGLKSVTKVVYTSDNGDNLKVEAFAEGGDAEVLSLKAWTMKSVWDTENDNYSHYKN